jgi:hypothetical protein
MLAIVDLSNTILASVLPNSNQREITMLLQTLFKQVFVDFDSWTGRLTCSVIVIDTVQIVIGGRIVVEDMIIEVKSFSYFIG